MPILDPFLRKRIYSRIPIGTAHRLPQRLLDRLRRTHRDWPQASAATPRPVSLTQTPTANSTCANRAMSKSKRERSEKFAIIANSLVAMSVLPFALNHHSDGLVWEPLFIPVKLSGQQVDGCRAQFAWFLQDARAIAPGRAEIEAG